MDKKEKTTEHKDNISAGFHPGIDNYTAYKDKISGGFHLGISSCECKKIVSDILGEIEFSVGVGSALES